MKNLGLCQKACTGQSVYGHALNREILPLMSFTFTKTPHISFSSKAVSPLQYREYDRGLLYWPLNRHLGEQVRRGGINEDLTLLQMISPQNIRFFYLIITQTSILTQSSLAKAAWVLSPGTKLPTYFILLEYLRTNTYSTRVKNMNPNDISKK